MDERAITNGQRGVDRLHGTNSGSAKRRIEREPHFLGRGHRVESEGSEQEQQRIVGNNVIIEGQVQRLCSLAVEVAGSKQEPLVAPTAPFLEHVPTPLLVTVGHFHRHPTLPFDEGRDHLVPIVQAGLRVRDVVQLQNVEVAGRPPIVCLDEVLRCKGFLHDHGGRISFLAEPEFPIQACPIQVKLGVPIVPKGWRAPSPDPGRCRGQTRGCRPSWRVLRKPLTLQQRRQFFRSRRQRRASCQRRSPPPVQSAVRASFSSLHSAPAYNLLFAVVCRRLPRNIVTPTRRRPAPRLGLAYGMANPLPQRWSSVAELRPGNCELTIGILMLIEYPSTRRSFLGWIRRAGSVA